MNDSGDLSIVRSADNSLLILELLDDNSDSRMYRVILN